MDNRRRNRRTIRRREQMRNANGEVGVRNRRKAPSLYGIAQDMLTARIVDDLGDITKERQALLYEYLVKKLIEALDNKKVLQFTGLRLISGKIRVACVDLTTLDWLKETMKTIPALWPDAKLKLADNETRTTTVVGFFPGVILENEKIFKKLEGQNDTISTKDWIVYQRDEVEAPDAGIKLTIGVDEKSLLSMMALSMKLYYDFTRVPFRSSKVAKKADEAEKPDESRK